MVIITGAGGGVGNYLLNHFEKKGPLWAPFVRPTKAIHA